MTIHVADDVCSKCRTRLVLTHEGSCMICGFSPSVPVELGKEEPSAERLSIPIPIRPLPDMASPSVREAIVASYETYGLVQTAEDFGIKPSTLVLRLKKWGVHLHGRGWKPEHVKPKISAHGTNGSESRTMLIHLVEKLDDLERAVQRSAAACGAGEGARAYQAGRLEMLEFIRLMLRQAAN